ncbi:hypothetical protein CCP4SC76_4430003 [Gammaproteobacteria bacterium]
MRAAVVGDIPASSTRPGSAYYGVGDLPWLLGLAAAGAEDVGGDVTLGLSPAGEALGEAVPVAFTLPPHGEIGTILLQGLVANAGHLFEIIDGLERAVELSVIHNGLGFQSRHERGWRC